MPTYHYEAMDSKGQEVKDVIEALMGLMASLEATGKVFNVGGTEEINIESLAKKIIGMTGSDSRIEFIPYEVAFGKDFEDMQRRVPDIQKIKGCIGFEPKTNLHGILERVIYDMSRNLGASSR